MTIPEKTRRIFVRLTPREKREALAAAKRAGLTFSEWARRAIDEKLRRPS